MGQILRAGGTRFRIHNIHKAELVEKGALIQHGDLVELEHCETKERKKILKGTLLARLGVDVTFEDDGQSLMPPTANEAERSAIAKIPLDMQSAATNRELMSLLRWISGLKSMGYDERSSEEELSQAMRSLESSMPGEIKRYQARTIKDKLVKLKMNDNDTRVLTPRYSQRGGRGSPRGEVIAEELLQKRIAEEMKKKTPLRPVDLLGGHVEDVNNHNLTPGAHKTTPLSESTIRRRFDAAFDAYQIAVRNKGKKAAQRQFRSAGVRWRAEEPLLASQFDDTDGEVFLIDDRTGMPWGRANVTMGIDENTRSILGREISETPRDVWAATSALVNAILPKDMSADEFELCEKAWYAYGKLGEVQMDNAMWYRSPKLVEGVIADAQAMPVWSKPKTPTGKTDIEHLNHFFKIDFTPTLPGWRGPKRDREGLKEGPGTAVMDLAMYVKLANKWMTDRYPLFPQEDGLCPWDRWSMFFKGREPVMPRDTQRFRLIATVREQYTFRDSGGLLRMGLRYGNKQLDRLREQIGSAERVQTRIHPRDLSRIYVLHPRLQTFIEVPCVETDAKRYITGLTNYQQKLILAKCRDQGIKNPSLKDCVAAKEAIRKIANQLRHSKKVSERRKGYRQRMDDAEPGILTDNTSNAAVAKAQEGSTPDASEPISYLSEVERVLRHFSDDVSLEDNEPGFKEVEERA